ncbi:MAG: TRAP transporter large permease subunit [Bacteroidota bacterium]
MEVLGIVMFLVIFILILIGYPVALTLAGVATIFGLLFVPDFLDLLPLRIMGVMQNYVLIAVPLFIFMGLMLEKSGLAESLLETMAKLFGKVRGGLAVSVVIVGALLAASTGIVGATVITMGLISLPTMLKQKYSPQLATGVIASSGTLGQIIPPSIVLILLGSVLNVSVGDMFSAALLPGLLLVGIYIVYILVISRMYPDMAPQPEKLEYDVDNKTLIRDVIKAFLMPLLLILAVLGSIFTGVASPTEAAAVGALGAIVLAVVNNKFKWSDVKDVARNTTHLTSMVFLILLGATTFALVFKGLGGDDYLTKLITGGNLSPMAFLLMVMVVVFIAGFFIDFIEIIFIIVPVVAPIFIAMKMDLVWIGILLALNLQTSFLSPPFGFALFYLKGVAPPEIKTEHIYRGIIPFLVLQVLVLLLVLLWPDFIYLLG